MIFVNALLIFRKALTSKVNSKKFPSLQYLSALCIWRNQEKFDNKEFNIFELIRKT